MVNKALTLQFRSTSSPFAVVVSVFQNIFTIVFSTEFIIGMLGNGFIALVNCLDWVKIRKISLVDQILTALAISRICLILLMLVTFTARDLQPYVLLSRKNVIVIGICWGVANHISVWFTAILSLFYFLKIATFSNPVFLYLKQRVRKVIQVTFLVILAFLPFNVTMTNIYMNAFSFSHERNVTGSDVEEVLQVTLFTLESVIPFSASMIFFLLLLFSLWKHLKNMKGNATRTRDPSTKAHIKAMKIMISFLLLFAVYFLCVLLSALPINIPNNKLFFVFCCVLGIVYPSAHSLILIMGNGKLRKAFLLVQWQLRCS